MTGYKITTICGSMRFYDAMLKLAKKLTIEGEIVLMPFAICDDKPNGDVTQEEKRALDDLHFAKIDMSDRVVFVTDENGYMGESTRAEFVHAAQQDKVNGVQDIYEIGLNL